MVHKIWHASDFILIFSRKGDNSDKKKRRVSATFPWGIHIWKFKTLACTVRMPQKVSQTDACADNLNTICPINFFEVGGIIKLFPLSCYNMLDPLILTGFFFHSNWSFKWPGVCACVRVWVCVVRVCGCDRELNCCLNESCSRHLTWYHITLTLCRPGLAIPRTSHCKKRSRQYHFDY